MSRTIPRALAAALAGALAGAAFLVFAFNRHPDLTFEMDRDLPARVTSGFYPVEFSREETFAWTSDRAQINVPGVDRRWPWRCVARVRGARAADVAQPVVTLAIDGTSLGSRPATNDYQQIEAVAPARPDRGLKLTISSSSTFVPGPADPRPLGVQVDRASCRPEAGRMTLPPAGTLAGAAVAAAALGAAFGSIGLPTAVVLAATLLVALVQSWPLSIGLAPYSAYADRVVWMACWIAALLLVGIKTAEWSRRHVVTTAASVVAAFSAATLYIKLLALLHPSKAIVDALFHAHRLEYVLSGRYFFTQVMPGGVQFPYAIALYVVASPWAALTHDHIALLRVVVSAAEALSGICLYWAIARTWDDRRIAVVAVMFLHVLPVSYWIVGNANLTNGFGESAALVAMTAAIAWPLGSRDWLQVIALAALTALAFLSHVSTCALLGGTMVAAAFWYRWRGGRAFTPPARSIVLSVVIAAVASIAVYYGRPEFFDAYKSVRGAKVETVDTSGASTPAEGSKIPPGERLAEGAIPTTSLAERVGSAVVLVGDALSWPILVLGVVGLWRAWIERATGRLTWAVAAWATACGAFLVFGILAPGGVGHQRQAMEFIARAAYAGSPALIVLAARGLVWAWGASAVTRFAGAGLAGLAGVSAAQQWLGWIQ